MKIGFIGFGEAAYYLALGLKGEGLTGIRACDAMQDHPVRGSLVKDRAAEAGVELMESNQAIAEWADMICNITPAQFAKAALESVMDLLGPDKLFVDLSSSTPKNKAEMAELVKKTGAKYTDATMLGSLPASKHKVQIIACGPGAAEFKEIMDPWGMNIEYNPGAPGTASAIKLVRSIYMKGIEALLLEMLQAADAYGVVDDVVPSICASMDKDPFEVILNRLVTGMAIHCVRRGSEVQGSVEMLQEAGIDSCMSESTVKRHMDLAKYGFADKYAGKKPVWQDIINDIKSGKEA
ncbi:MAG: NAD(P)-dependent oxidoreductase [Firmicutes bacterium]|nr:NAD(P)-dependent oxidoreductase [Bacillota bacterium]